jgi:hypothetical protein
MKKCIKGPWEFTTYLGDRFSISHRGNTILEGGLADHPIYDKEELEPIIVLMAKAPELREALVCCVGFISGEHSNTEIDKEEVLEMAKDALAQT